MKYIVLILILLVAINISCKTSKPSATGLTKKSPVSSIDQKITPATVNFSDKSTWILGYFSLEKLAREPYSAWYLKEYEDYQINSNVVNHLLDISKDNVKIKIVMGTWCPDSRREVPRMIRILDIWRFPMTQVSFIGVDKTKHTFVREYESLKIEKVPTFIIYKNNVEAGRIIETPSTSLEQDLVNILTRNE
jgi:thiol-disulfide isomerase/thioredoxin